MTSALQRDIDAIVSQLVTHYKPEKIILFGSAARGETGPDSDLDFFIVKRDVPRRGIDRYADLLNRVDYRTASDFLICTPEEVSIRMQLGDPFVRDIMEKGVVLYG